MLTALRVSNFRSFRDPQELSLVRAKQASVPKLETRISPVAAIYGANAAGKSSVFQSMKFLKRVVSDSYRRWNDIEGLPAMPFFLDRDSFEKPSEIEIEFRAADGLTYQYGFAANGVSVVREWLYVYKSAQRSLLFDRDGESQSIRFGAAFRGSRSEMRHAAKQRVNALSLSVGVQVGVESLQPAARWIESLRLYDARDFKSEHEDVVERLVDDVEFKARLLEVLSKTDLGIVDIKVEQDSDGPIQPDILRKMLAVAGEEPRPGVVEDFVRRRGQKLELAHSIGPGYPPFFFPLEWESEGTRALISFASLVVDTLAAGGCLFVDEIDSSLHPLLVRELVSLYQDERTNKAMAQLVFTTHDVSLLSKTAAGHQILDRDQIWVVEKDAHGASSLIGLSEYKMPRADENLERGYLTGRFGGVPSISLFHALAGEDSLRD